MQIGHLSFEAFFKKKKHDTTYEALRAEARDISVSYNGLNLQALFEPRTKDKCIRVMLKVSTPLDGKVCQAGSYAFQVLNTGKVIQQAYLARLDHDLRP